MTTQAVGSRPSDRARESGGVRVLLAADDLAVRLTLEAVLCKSGYLVDSVASSGEAMEKIENSQYALVLCDLRGESSSAGRSVIQVARAQRDRPATALLKAKSDPCEECDEDADEILVKPVEVERLLTEIADLLANRAYGRAARRTGA